jgi:hypothetical protein
MTEAEFLQQIKDMLVKRGYRIECVALEDGRVEERVIRPDGTVAVIARSHPATVKESPQ